MTLRRRERYLACARKRTTISRTSSPTRSAKLDEVIAEKCEAFVIFNDTNEAVLHLRRFKYCWIEQRFGWQIFTDVFRSVVSPFRIKRFDESDYEQTEFEEGQAVAQLVVALRNDPEGRGFHPSLGIFHLLNSSSGTMARWSTQPVT